METDYDVGGSDNEDDKEADEARLIHRCVLILLQSSLITTAAAVCMLLMLKFGALQEYMQFFGGNPDSTHKLFSA